MYLTAQVIIILLAAVVIIGIYRTLDFVFQQFHIPPAHRKRSLGYIAIGLILWLAILTALSFSGFFRNFDVLPPRIALAVLPPTVLILILLFSPSFYNVLKRIPPDRLIYAQSIRIIVELVFWLGLIGGFVPFQMTFEGFNYDIIVGITALPAGYTFFGKGRYRRPEAIIWNIFGIVLLLFIVFISIISTPSPFQVFFNEPVNTFMANFPFIWIPGFIVPFALAMHLFSLKQLLLLPEN